jgi:hypothetical protein
MKSFLWLVVGVLVGIIVAHRLPESPRSRLLGDFDRRARDFGAAVSDGYRRREEELRSAIDSASDTIEDLSR